MWRSWGSCSDQLAPKTISFYRSGDFMSEWPQLLSTSVSQRSHNPLPVTSPTARCALRTSASCLFSKLPLCSSYSIKAKPLCLLPVQTPFSHVSPISYGNLSSEVDHVSFVFQVRNLEPRRTEWLFLDTHLIGNCPMIRGSICLTSKFGSFRMESELGFEGEIGLS